MFEHPHKSNVFIAILLQLIINYHGFLIAWMALQRDAAEPLWMALEAASTFINRKLLQLRPMSLIATWSSLSFLQVNYAFNQ